MANEVIGVHASVALCDKLQQTKAQLETIWRVIDTIDPTRQCTQMEQVGLADLRTHLERAIEDLSQVLNANAGKPTSQWR